MQALGKTTYLARDLSAAQIEQNPDQGTLDTVSHIEKYVAPSLSFQAAVGGNVGAWELALPHGVLLAPWGSHSRPHIFTSSVPVSIWVLWDGEPRRVTEMGEGGRLAYHTLPGDVECPGIDFMREVGLTVPPKGEVVLNSTTTLCVIVWRKVTGIDALVQASPLIRATYIQKLSRLPPKPDVALSELPVMWRGLSNIMRRVPVVNASYGHTVKGHYRLTLRGEYYTQGLGFWAPMALNYNLEGKDGRSAYCAFVAVVGIGEGYALSHFKGHLSAPFATAEILLYIDGVEVHRSPVLTTQGEPWPIMFKIPPRAKVLRLVVGDSGDGHMVDYVDMADVGLIWRGQPACE